MKQHRYFTWVVLKHEQPQRQVEGRKRRRQHQVRTAAGLP